MPLPSSSPIGAAITPRRVPEAYVRAEIGGYPLTSVEAFRSGLVELDPALEQPEPTFWLWRSCEKDFAQHVGGLSLDRMVAVRDYTWFSRSDASRAERASLRLIPMHEYLRHLASTHVEPAYGIAELRQEVGAHATGDAIDAILHYRWLTFALPEDLLLAAVRRTPPPTKVDLGYTLFRRQLLDAGVAEIHQHAWAGWDFPLVWVGALAALADPAIDEACMVSAGALFGEGRDFARWLLVGAIVRLILAEFLMARRHVGGGCGSAGTLSEYRNTCIGRSRRRVYRTIADAFDALTGQPEMRAPDASPPAFAALQAAYGELHPIGLNIATDGPKRLADVWRCDPIAARLDLSGTYGEGERWLVRHALAYLEGAGSADRDFAVAFWQSQRMRCLYYRHLVERPLTAGLQWFIRFYGRISPLLKPLNGLQPEASFRISGRGERMMGALELRAGGKDDAPALASDMSDLVASWRQVLEDRGSVAHHGEVPEFGVVIGFSKTRDAQARWLKGHPMAFGERTHAEPRGSWRLRFHDFLSGQSPMATALADLLCAVPLTLWLIRGIDVTTDELAVPTWVLVPLFRYVRQEASYASVLPGAKGAPPLQTTVHVGEDFRHLMEGMRRIYEAIRYLLERSGGRLGHAIALGQDPLLWAESVGSVFMPKEDRLWDLVFEWRLYTGFGIPREFLATAPPGRVERVRNLIADLADYLWAHCGESGSSMPRAPRELAALHDRLHQFMLPRGTMTRVDVERAIQRGFRSLYRFRLSEEEMDAIERALYAYLEDPALFRAGQELVDVPIDASEVEGLSAVQDALRRGIALRGMVVEANPTSNLLIGDLLDLRRHPLLRLFPVEPDGSIPPVPIALGSDDPITFSTSLAGEYAIMYEMARSAGYSALAIDGWLERIRQNGFNARFTRAWRPDADTMADDLQEALNGYLLRPHRHCGQWKQGRCRDRSEVHGHAAGHPWFRLDCR